MMMILNTEKDFQTILQFKYPEADALNTPNDKLNRASKLMKASLMDSISKSDAILIIQSQESMQKIRSRVIAVGNERVMLERGISIPLACIVDVEFP